MKYIWILLSALILTSCSAAPTQPASYFNPPMNSLALSVDSTSEQIQTAMRQSAAYWQTLQASGTITWYGADGATQTYREQAWLDPAKNRYKVLLTNETNPADQTLRFSDGQTNFNVNLTSGLTESSPYHASAPEQMWGQIGTPLTEMMFPYNYAQNQGAFKPLRTETIAGRKALAVEWTYIENNAPSWTLWLDTSTAVILKLQEYAAKEGSNALQAERAVENIVYNLPLDDSLFAMPADAPQAIFPTPVDSAPLITPNADVPNLGELYFFLQPRQNREQVELVKISGACILDGATCPPVEKIRVPFELKFTLNALNWSPSGNLAAFAYPDNAAGTPQKLFLFDPQNQTWSSIAQFPYIDPPFWSPDGAWIAFRAQDGYGAEEAYVIRADGTGLRKISDGLPLEGRPYVMDGWYQDAVLMRPAVSGGSLYAARASDGAAQPMFNAALTKNPLLPAPDAPLFAYDDFDYAAQTHAIKILNADGSLFVDVAQFLGGGVYPLVWSPNGSLLAFNHYSSFNNGQPLAEVYVALRDGAKLSLAYRGTTVGRLVFSPNGQYLLAEETTSISGGHLFTVNLATMEQKILRAPGLSTDYDWYAPSWRP
ncbi:MAG: hypothetical protein Fur002_16690 [Anaerolineales bacterium]